MNIFRHIMMVAVMTGLTFSGSMGILEAQLQRNINQDVRRGNAMKQQKMREKIIRQQGGMAEKTVSAAPANLKYIDTHNHLVGKLNGGPYDPTQTALDAMNAAGVKMNFIMPMPQHGEQKNKLFVDDILPAVAKHPDRFAILGGGGTLNVMIQKAIKDGGVSDAIRNEFDATAKELIQKGVVGFGEMTAEHFSMNPDHPYVTAPPDHELFLRLADLAAQYNMPVDIHMEAIPEAMPMPAALKSSLNPAALIPNIGGFERLLAHNRNAKIVWVHLGWDATGNRTVALTRKLLERNSNLYLSLRIASGMQAKGMERATFPLDAQGRLKADWLQMFRDFPGRFVIGSDEIIQGSNRHPSAGSIKSTWGMFDQLPADLKAKIGYENVYKIYKIAK